MMHIGLGVSSADESFALSKSNPIQIAEVPVIALSIDVAMTPFNLALFFSAATPLSFTAASLPVGLALSTAGVLSGTARSTVPAQPFSFEVRNDRGRTLTFTVTIVVGAGTPTAFAAADWTLDDPRAGDALTVGVLQLPMDGGAPLLGIERRVNGGAWLALGSATIGDAVIESLAPGVATTVELRAVNAAGAGPAGEAKVATPTTTQVPSRLAAPVLDADGRTRFSLRVVFAASADDGGSAVLGYDLRWSTDGLAWTERRASDGATPTPTTIDNLSAGVEHRVAVRAVNAVGAGAWSPELRAATAEPLTPAAPLPPNVVETGETTINLRLEPTVDDGGAPVLRQDLRWSANGGASWTESLGVGEFAVAKDLASDTAHLLSARAVNAVGAGAWSATAAARTLPAVVATGPAAFANSAWRVADAVTDGAAYLWIDALPASAEPITGLRYRVDGGVPVALDATVRGLYPIHGLTNGQPTVIEVAAVTAAAPLPTNWSAAKTVTPTRESVARFACWADGERHDVLPAPERVGATETDLSAVNRNRPLQLAEGGEIEFLHGASSPFATVFDRSKAVAAPNLVPVPDRRHFDPLGRYDALRPGETAAARFWVDGVADATTDDAMASTDLDLANSAVYSSLAASTGAGALTVSTDPLICTLTPTSGFTEARIFYQGAYALVPGASYTVAWRFAAGSGSIRPSLRGGVTVDSPENYTATGSVTLVAATGNDRVFLTIYSGKAGLTIDEITIQGPTAPEIVIAKSTARLTGSTEGAVVIHGAAGMATHPALSAVALDGDGDPVPFRFDRQAEVGRLPDGRPFVVGPVRLMRNGGAPVLVDVDASNPWEVVGFAGAQLAVVYRAGLFPPTTATLTPDLAFDYVRHAGAFTFTGWNDGTAAAASSTGLTIQEGFETLHLHLDSTSTDAAEVRFRKVGETPFNPALPLSYDDRNPATTGGGVTDFVFGRHRQSIQYLAPGTEYEVQVRQGSSYWRRVVTTKSYKTARASSTVWGVQTGNVTISSGGTLANPVEFRNGVFRGGKLTINASHVVIRDVDFRGAADHCVVLGAGVRNVRFIRCRFSGWGGNDLHRGSDANGWGEQFHSGVYVGAGVTNVAEILMIGCEWGSPRWPTNTWEHDTYNTSTTGNHPWGPQAISIQTGNREGRWVVTDCTIAPDAWRGFNDCIAGNNNKSLSNGGIGPAFVLAWSYLTGACDDLVEVEGPSVNVVLTHNRFHSRQLYDWSSATRFTVAVSAVTWGPCLLNRNVHLFDRPSGLNQADFSASIYKIDRDTEVSDNLRGRLFLYHETAGKGSGIAPTEFAPFLGGRRHITGRNNIYRTVNAQPGEMTSNATNDWSNNIHAQNDGAFPIETTIYQPTAGATALLGQAVMVPNVNDAGPWGSASPDIGAVGRV